ncbi:MAG: hypothetical protein K6C33_11320 [Desulfovibrio sp.]|nr:hypothetical protein [Desulfovibrio sp.]
MSTIRSLSRFFALMALLCLSACLAGCALPGLGSDKPQRTPGLSPGPCVVLVLPNTGNFAPISKKIETGAQLAKSSFSRNGATVHVKVIYTQPGWVEQVRALPKEFAVVGGFLQPDVFKQALSSGLTRERNVFAFLGKLPAGTEGVDAWRFFASAEDQADAVVRLLADDLGCRSVGALYPNDKFSLRMTGLLEEKLAGKGIVLARSAYSGQADGAAKLLVGSGGDIEAVFLPDSWKQIDMLKRSLANAGAPSAYMVGTMIWNGFLNARPLASAASYPLAVFPSSFSRSVAPAPFNSGSYDAWHALGYDFVRFACRLNFERSYPAATANKYISGAARMNYAQAPISYDAAGRAHQKLFMLQPGTQGAVLVNQASLKAKRDAIKLNPKAVPPAPVEPAPASQPAAPAAVPAPASQPAAPGAAPAARLIDPSKPASPLPRRYQADDYPAVPDAGRAAPDASQAPAAQSSQPAPAQPVMPTRRHTSYKLSLPTPQQQ